jgi:cell division septation protein DedD
MQKSKNTLNKSSTQIQKTIDDRRKSRRRVLGSIILLCIALAALLNVTAHVKPIPINPEVVEIKDANASNTVANLKTNASGTPLVTASAPLILVAESTKTAPILAAAPASIPTTESNMGFKAGIVANEKKTSSSVAVATKPIAPVTPKAVVNKKPVLIDPAAILDDVADSQAEPTVTTSPSPKISPSAKTSGKAYIQFAALSTPEKAASLQQSLSSKGINASVEPIVTSKGTLYRLRAGPFNRQDATTKLKQISADGYSGIITGN